MSNTLAQGNRAGKRRLVRLKQIFFDEWARGVWCGGRRVHLRIADVGRGRDDAGRDGQAVVVPGHVLRTVRGDHRSGGRGDHGRGGGRHDRGGLQGYGKAGRGGGGHDGETAREERKQRLENVKIFTIHDCYSVFIVIILCDEHTIGAMNGRAEINVFGKLIFSNPLYKTYVLVDTVQSNMTDN